MKIEEHRAFKIRFEITNEIKAYNPKFVAKIIDSKKEIEDGIFTLEKHIERNNFKQIH